MTIDRLEVTSQTSREELLVYVGDLEEEIELLENKVRDREHEIEDLRLAPEQLCRLEEASDLLAAQGIIHDTPAGKTRWMEGR